MSCVCSFEAKASTITDHLFLCNLHPDHRERAQQYSGKNIAELIEDGSAHHTQTQIKTFNIELLEAERLIFCHIL